ncbi:MAG: hypothetical protein SPM02_02085 [Bacteroidales bacterium]|nr:hypothetical protein [Bacteroidales bacterium]
MKKVLFLALMCAIIGSWGNVQAQNCDKLLQPYYERNNYNPEDYPIEKADWRCRFARAAFYFTNSLPKNAIVYNITDVTNYLTGKKIGRDYVVDLDEMSYYAYNFDYFQYTNDKKTVYFRLNNGDYRYLVLRSYIDQMTYADILEKE